MAMQTSPDGGSNRPQFILRKEQGEGLKRNCLSLATSLLSLLACAFPRRDMVAKSLVLSGEARVLAKAVGMIVSIGTWASGSGRIQNWELTVREQAMAGERSFLVVQQKFF